MSAAAERDAGTPTRVGKRPAGRAMGDGEAILFVEDNQYVRASVGRMLQALGDTVTAAAPLLRR